MLLTHLILSIVQECSRISTPPAKTWWNTIMHEPQCVDPLLAIALEGHFIGDHGIQPQSNTAEEGTVSAVHLLQFLHANSRWTLNIYFSHQQAKTQKPRSKSSWFIKGFIIIIVM